MLESLYLYVISWRDGIIRTLSTNIVEVELYRLTSTINAVKNADVLIVIGTCYQTSLPQRILGLCKTNNTPILDVNPNLNDDVFSAPLLMVKETGTVFLNTLMDKLNKKKKTIKSKKNRKK